MAWEQATMALIDGDTEAARRHFDAWTGTAQEPFALFLIGNMEARFGHLGAARALARRQEELGANYMGDEGVAGAKTAMSPFFSPIIVLFFAGFLMAEAMRGSPGGLRISGRSRGAGA